MLSLAALVLCLLPIVLAQETVLGVFIFHRHGDRTAKSTPPSNLTALGYSEILTSGTYYRNRYIASNAPLRIQGVNSDLVKQSQISASAPSDTVLFSSCEGFLQGLYPPVGTALGTQTLRNGTIVQAPLGGYQLIPIGSVSTGANSENTDWLQSSTDCANALTSSNEYFYTPEYQQLLNSTQQFYNNIYPVINQTFAASQDSYHNAYTIYDLINVANIHNTTIQSSDLLTSSALFQLRTLADQHEYNLAWNASSPIRGIAGMTLAAQIVDFLNSTVTTKGGSKLGVQFGNYATFTSFFGLAGLLQTNPDFYGITDYTSSMVFELFTNSSLGAGSEAANFPAESDLSVRFLFHNGTASNLSEPTLYPLFGTNQQSVSWNEFTASMGKFSVGSTQDWCGVCGNTTGTCAQYYQSAPTSFNSSSSNGSSGSTSRGMSLAVAGVIGAMVTLGVILGLEALVLLLGGFRLMSKKRVDAPNNSLNGGNGVKA